MKYKITKLNQLQHIDSFMQINYLRGFKYIDKAGEIVNLFFTGKQEPPYQMTQRELIIKESVADSKTYRVAVDNVWSHDASPQNFGNLEQNFQKKSLELLALLDISEITRIGWRNYFVYEFQNPEDKNKILSKLSPISDSELVNFGFQKNIEDIKCKFIIKGAEKRDEKKTPAIIFDIDCSRSFIEDPVSIKNIVNTLQSIRDVFNSEAMLGVVNLILSASSNNSQDKLKK